jgi:iduronate 2-sulfatase
VPSSKGASSWCIHSGNESELLDAQIAGHAISLLHLARNRTAQPFFIMVGFVRPHAPWIVPERHWHRQPLERSLARRPHVSDFKESGKPMVAFNAAWLSASLTEAKEYNRSMFEVDPTTSQDAPDDVQRSHRRGYFAAVSWMDEQVGRVINALDQRADSANTLVVVHGDHGYNLGEFGQWHKCTTNELGTRVPLLMRAPWTGRGGVRVEEPVELLDLFPTVAALAGAPQPSGPMEQAWPLEGKDFSHLLTHAPVGVDEQKAAFSQFPRCSSRTYTAHVGPLSRLVHSLCSSDHLHYRTANPRHSASLVPFPPTAAMGYSIRTIGWRYTAWVPFSNGSATWDTSQLVAHELYRHDGPSALMPATECQADFDECELSNVVGRPQLLQLQQRLHKSLQTQFSRPSMPSPPTHVLANVGSHVAHRPHSRDHSSGRQKHIVRDMNISGSAAGGGVKALPNGMAI